MRKTGHGLLVFALLVALLTAPCLSVLGMFGSGGAHAHGAQAHVAHDHSAHGVRHAQASHGQISEAGLSVAGAVHDPAQQPASCCRLCDGWRTQTVRDAVLAQPLPRPDPLPVMAQTGPRFVLTGLEKVEPPSGSIPPASYLLARLTAGDQPLYAATRRLRI